MVKYEFRYGGQILTVPGVRINESMQYLYYWIYISVCNSVCLFVCPDCINESTFFKFMKTYPMMARLQSQFVKPC